MDEARESSYDPELLATNVSSRLITLAAIRDAAGAVYGAAIRTPLIRVELPDGPEPWSLPQARSAAADRLVQDPRRLQRRPPADAGRSCSDGVWTVSAGNAAQGVAFAARKAGARCSVMVMDTAPDTKIRAIERLGATIVRATYDECWRTVETHGSDRMTGYFVHPFDDDRFIAGNATAGLEILEDLPDVDAIVAPLGGGGLLAGHRRGGAGAEARHAHLRRRTGDRGAARRRRSPPAGRCTSTTGRRRSSTAPAASRC